MIKKTYLFLAVLVVGGALTLHNALFIVQETEQVLVLQFGEAKRTVQEPGLHLKIPFVQNLRYYDDRVLQADPPSEQLILGDQKRLVVDTFTRFRIADPLRFFQAVNNEVAARSRLADIIISALRRELGNVTLATLLSEERDAIMQNITVSVNASAQNLGLDVIDVRIRRADLPEETSQAIYDRITSERKREAQEFRAQGEEEALRIRSSADREGTVIIAEAQNESQVIRGEGDALAVRIYADSFGADPNFFAFYRSMEAYRNSLTDQDTTLVLSPDSDFFRFFGSIGGGGAALPPAAPTAPAAASVGGTPETTASGPEAPSFNAQ